MSNKDKLLAGLILLAFIVLNSISYACDSVLQHPEAQHFIDEMVSNDNFDRAYLEQVFSQAQLQPKIIEAMSHPAEGLPWHRYKQIFLTDKRIQQGVDFWNTHQATLARAEEEYGVPAKTIVAIIGVETFYGKHQGTYRVIDALSTLAFDFPKRATFFRKELREYLLMARENQLDPLSFTGSYAGAFGQGQFMPSSYRHYAVDFSGKHEKDLQHNTDDAIGSVANYLRKNGWQPQHPVTSHVNKGNPDQFKQASQHPTKPKTPLADLRLSIDDDVSTAEAATLMEFAEQDQNDYWVGYQNFYAITRYNPSLLYAMAVHQLGESIEEARKQHA